jgi:hypothetical protein
VETGTPASAQALLSALDLLEARALFEGPERAVHVRIAEHADHIYLDLADEQWRAVEVGRDGWRLLVAPPVRFRRPPGLLPIPAPERGGSIELLASFVNLPNRDDFVLLVAWLLAALRARGPYPLLAVSGEQGSAKTVLSKLIKALVDPNVAPVRTLARDERELMIAANNGHLLAFDNLSHLPVRLSDALCRLATGGSFAVRQLYTDEDEVLFQAARPILLNSIEDVINRPDLADRAIFLTLPPIAENLRRAESELWRNFENARPAILGALLDAMVVGLRELPAVRLAQLPRMADFAIWSTACERALWPLGTFSHAYESNRRAAVENVIDADPVAACVRDIIAEQNTWIGTAANLLRAGIERGGDFSRSRAGWPKTPHTLAGRLRRAQTFLRTLGIDIAFHREGRAGSRVIRIRTAFEDTVSTARDNGSRPGPRQPPVSDSSGCDDDSQLRLVGPRPTGPVFAATVADDADGADANSAFAGSRGRPVAPRVPPRPR